MKEYTYRGQVDDEGTMRLPMNQLREEIKRHRGANVIVTIRVEDKGDTTIMKTWYRKHALSRVVRAWRELGENYTEEQADRELRKLTTVCHKKIADEEVIVDIDMLDRGEMLQYIQEVQLFSNINLNTVL